MVMQPLMARVHPDDRVLRCETCDDDVIPQLSERGPHIRADCSSCGRYLKFARQQPYQEPEWNDV